MQILIIINDRQTSFGREAMELERAIYKIKRPDAK